MNLILKLVVHLIVISESPTWAQLSQFDETIFDSDFCNEKCENEVHSMCPLKHAKASCKPFELHAIKKNTLTTGLMETLINGHNGVRNRIADRMKVPNMLKLSWDTKLARMAENYLYKCKTLVADPCTVIPIVMLEEETIAEFFKFRLSKTFIMQNTFVEKSPFVPFRFVERIIRSWYFHKDGMREPTAVDIDHFQRKRLLGENNFTHLAYPYLYRFGCAMARFHGAFHMICNYYPFFRTVTNTMYFQTGETATQCPPRFPMRDKMFEHLCTDDSTFITGSTQKSKSEKRLILLTLLLTIYEVF